jgi:hypothetical protein
MLGSDSLWGVHRGRDFNPSYFWKNVLKSHGWVDAKPEGGGGERSLSTRSFFILFCKLKPGKESKE